MNGIVEFIKQRITEDEAMARAASERSLDWWSEGKGVAGGPFDEADPEGGMAKCGEHTIVYDEGYPRESEALHIARHDPARVLRQCAALRRALVEFDGCSWCEPTKAEEVERYAPLAAIWSDHPDFREEWKL